MTLLKTLFFGPRLRPLRIALFAALVIAVAWLALAPRPPVGISTGWDKTNHLLAFAALLCSGRLAWARRPALLALALLAYGGLIELLQLQIPGRDGEWADLLADACGMGLGLLVFLLLRRLLLTRT